MDDCFRWKLLAGVLAFLLAFSTFQLTLLWADANYNYYLQEAWKDEICRLTKMIGERDDKQYYCLIPSFHMPQNNIFMQPID